MTLEIPVDDHYGVGPYSDVYSHGPVTVFVPPGEDRGMLFAACLDCGFVAADVRYFLHAECDPAKNHVNQSWREKIGEDGFPDPPDWEDDED